MQHCSLWIPVCCCVGKCAQRWGRFLLVRANMKACVPDTLCYGIAAVFFFPFFALRLYNLAINLPENTLLFF